MQLSKIGSKNTYHKCMKELHLFSYLIYHTAVTKYQPVRVSIIRLDIKQPVTKFHQLELFSIPSPLGERLGVRCTENKTQPVSKLTNTSLNNETAQVPDLGHIIKPNILKIESNRHSQKIKEDKKIQGGKTNQSPHVPNSVHREGVTLRHSKGEGLEERQVPTQDQVKSYFTQSNYPSLEGVKFYNHYKALGWQLSNQPIHNWQALANKWMINGVGHHKANEKVYKTTDIDKEVEYLFQRYREGYNITNQITGDHFNHLNLELTEQIKTEAVRQRIKSLIGSNQHSINKLLQAYQEADINSSYILKDQPNLVLLAHRIAVLNHFNSQLNKET